MSREERRAKIDAVREEGRLALLALIGLRFQTYQGGPFKREIIVSTFHPAGEIDYCDPDGLHGDRRGRARTRRPATLMVDRGMINPTDLISEELFKYRRCDG